MGQKSLALHEAMEMHEILNFKAVSMTKSQTMQILVSDPQLKALMQREVELSAKAVSELKDLLSGVPQH